MTSVAFSPKRLDTKPLGTALAQGKIPRWVYSEVIARKVDLESAMDRIEKASEVSPFPPTVTVPEAIFDSFFKIVVHAQLTLYKKMKFVYLVIELSAPSIVYMNKSIFLGLLAHEFLHYVVHTLNLYKKICNLESKGNHESSAIVGVIPHTEGMTATERDRYFYADPTMWFRDDEVIRAVENLDSMKVDTTLTEKVMQWINEGKPMKEFEREKIIGFKGEPWFHQSILDKAKKLKML